MSSSRTGMQDSQQMEHDQAQMSGEDSQDMTVGYADEEESSRGGAGKMIVGVVLVAILAIIIGCCACGGSKEEEVKEAADEGAVQATEEEPNQGFLAPSAEGEVAESSEQSEGCPMWVILTSAIGGAVVVIVTTVIICCCCCGSSQNTAIIYNTDKSEGAKIQTAKFSDDNKTKMSAAETACKAMVSAAKMKESKDSDAAHAACAAYYGAHFTLTEVSKDKLKGLQINTSLTPEQYHLWSQMASDANASALPSGGLPPSAATQQAATSFHMFTQDKGESYSAAVAEKKGDGADLAATTKDFKEKVEAAAAAYKSFYLHSEDDSVFMHKNGTQHVIDMTKDTKAEDLKKEVTDKTAEDNTYVFAKYKLEVNLEKRTFELHTSVDPISACELSSSGAAKTEDKTPAK